MDKPTPVDRIEYVLKSIRSIKEFVKGESQDHFLNDGKLQSAVLFQFLIIGEDISNIDSSILQKYKYPWHIPISFRNLIVPDHSVIKMERIFHAANDLEELEKVMTLILEKEF